MKLVTSLFLSLVILTTASAQSPTVSYTLGMPRPSNHLFEIEVTYAGLPSGQASLDLLLPAWRSGRYVIFDFAGGVQEFSAVDGKGSTLAWEKTDKSTWRVQTGGATTVTGKYKVYANEFNMRTRGLSDEGAFLDGSSAFMYVDQYRNLPLTLTVVPYKDWHVTTGLEAVKGKKHTFSSPSYDYLVDCPLFVGNQKDFEFEAGGKKHLFSVLGEGNYDSKKVIEDLTKFVEINKGFWGSLPYEQYIFMLQLSPTSGGGTEHINSTAMGTHPFIFKDKNGYRGFLGLVSHEYFHTWNVKQIRPRGISPYDWTRENYTKELWIAEGTTSYYGSLLMVRNGFTEVSHYVEQLGNQIVGNRQRPGNMIQSASESSFDAWVKYWKGNQQSYNAESDYYDIGSDLSLFLDLEIRNRTANKSSLDDVMRAMYKRFPWDGSGYTVEDFRAICEEFAGNSFKEFFDHHVYGTKPLEWEKVLSFAGLEAKPKTDKKPWLGVNAFERNNQTRFFRVIAGSPAYEAGLDVNDELIALNGYATRANELNARIGEMKEGDKVTIAVMRNSMLREFVVTLKKNPYPGYTVGKVKEPTVLQKSIYESWLGTTWEKKETKKDDAGKEE